MPRAKQQDPVEAQEADVAVHEGANGVSRTGKAAAPAGKGVDKAETKTTVKAPAKAHEAPASNVSAGHSATSKAPAPAAKPAAAKEAKGTTSVAPKPEASSKPASTSAKADTTAKTDTSPKADASAKVDKPKVAKAVSLQKAPGIGALPATPLAADEDDEPRDVFLNHQRALLMAERNNYTRQAEELRAQAEALALEHEPGDVQFDEEGGEGGTANVDRELDLHLSAQAHAAIEEIDAALVKISDGTYGFCESCGNPVPKARLEALPHARLCVSCKSGGLSARRQ
jgi:DnaK suppressor protein